MFHRNWLGLCLCTLLSPLWCCLCWEAFRRKTSETLLHKEKGRRKPRKWKARSSLGQSRWGSTRQMDEATRDGRDHAACVHCPSVDDPPVIWPRKMSRANTCGTTEFFAESSLGMPFCARLWGISQPVPGCWSRASMGQEPSPKAIQVWLFRVGVRDFSHGDSSSAMPICSRARDSVGFALFSIPAAAEAAACSSTRRAGGCRCLRPFLRSSKRLCATCYCLMFGPNSCAGHVCCVVQAVWWQPSRSERSTADLLHAMTVGNTKWIWKGLRCHVPWKHVPCHGSTWCAWEEARPNPHHLVNLPTREARRRGTLWNAEPHSYLRQGLSSEIWKLGFQTREEIVL